MKGRLINKFIISDDAKKNEDESIWLGNRTSDKRHTQRVARWGLTLGGG